MRMLHDNGTSEPCKHMEGMLNRVADGTANRLTLWYTLAHTLRCPMCHRFLDSLKTMLSGLRRVPHAEPQEDVLGRLQQRLHQVSEQA